MGTLPTSPRPIDTGSGDIGVTGITPITVDRCVDDFGDTLGVHSNGSSLDGPSRRMRRPRSVRRIVSAVLLIAAFVIGMPAAGAQSGSSGCGEDGCVDAIAVNGVVDEIVASFIIDTIDRANMVGDVVAVVLQVDSAGVVISNDRLAELADVISNSRVPVSIWVGASGARALGGVAELALVADSTGIAPGAYVGRIGEPRLDPERLGERAVTLANRTYSGQAAVDAGVIDSFDPTLVHHVGNLDSVETNEKTVDGKTQRYPVPRVRLSKLSLPVQMLHTAASPSLAYLLLITGLGLLLFEFFTAGVGVAGVVGAGFILLAGFGLGELPFRGWALALMLASFEAFGIDMQTGLARLWTWLGYIGFVVASFFLFSEFGPTWPAMAVGLIGMAAFVFRGMPSMNRARFGTPFIGREWLVGESGVVTDPLDPVGTVRIRDVDWVARSSDDGAHPVGSQVIITGSDRLTVEVADGGSDAVS